MAEDIIVSGVGELLKTLTVLVANEITHAWGVKGDLKKLQTSLSMIQTVLEDADEKQQAKNRAVGEWLKRLKDVAYDTEDVMDEFSYEALRRRLEIQNRIKNKVRNFFSCSNPFAFRLKMAHKIKDINAELDEIVKDMGKLEIIKRNIASTHGLIAAPADPKSSSKNSDRETHAFVDHSKIVGREKDKAKLVTMLTDPSNQDDQFLSVIPIFGMGGLGKTTLAQLVYNDEQVKKHFNDLKMWVCVSDGDFDVKKLARAILESVDKSKLGDDSGLNVIACSLQEKLRGKKFLLVLDDVWNEDRDKWESLRALLLYGAKGSKIIVTTRSNEVAEIMGTLPTYELHALSDDESWSLFKQRAFKVGGGGDDETQNLVVIGKKIVEKCKGVPLSVKAIGSLLFSKREEREWSSILSSELWDLPEEKNKILPALRLSYDHLPSHLKQCFSFCSIFQKGDLIEIKTLIQLWMAEGLLQPHEGNKQMEDVGHEYFKELWSTSFFQVVEAVDEWRDITRCTIHDLVHDLAQVVSQSECFVLEANRNENISETRRLRVAFDRKTSAIPEALCMAKKLRVIFMGERFSKCKIENISMLMNLKSLCVLVLRNLKVKELPHLMLKHLRFLELKGINIEVLPEWITSLYHLLTIKVRSCHELKQLPSNIEKLTKLRHFEIEKAK